MFRYLDTVVASVAPDKEVYIIARRQPGFSLYQFALFEYGVVVCDQVLALSPSLPACNVSAIQPMQQLDACRVSPALEFWALLMGMQPRGPAACVR